MPTTMFLHWTRDTVRLHFMRSELSAGGSGTHSICLLRFTIFPGLSGIAGMRSARPHSAM
jgi:hypothetical protein